VPVNNYYKILFLPKWFPNKKDKFNGVFVESHALALAKHCNIAVLYVGADESLSQKFELEERKENNMHLVHAYYRNSDLGNGLFGKAQKLLRYFRATYIGLKAIKVNFGKPNLVHVHVLTRPGITALLLKITNKIPYVITEHWSGYLPADGSYKGMLKKFVTRLVVKKAAHITSVSEHLKNAMLQHQLNGNYSVIGNCIKLPNTPIIQNTSQLQAIAIGNIEDREKNIYGLIQAMKTLSSEIPELTLTLIGKGIDQKKLEKLSLDLGLSSKIKFVSEISHDEVYSYLSKSSFLILNSYFETFSVVAAEALACGIPVLATKCGGPEEFIRPEFGKLIPLNNPAELVAGIKWMCANHSSFDKLKMQEFVAENFNCEKIAAQLIHIYHPLIREWEAGNTREKISIPFNWKVLDVGSGDHPNERADVLLEREIEASEHRSGATAVIPEGKKLVLGDATEMPFNNKEFDFVIASHIAEHIDEPEKFCMELQRVAKNGYIETPDAFSEFIFNEQFHKWVVSNKNGVLVFKEKTKHKVFSEFFYRFYYLNEKRTNHEAMYSNSFVVVKFVNLIRKCWKYLPRTYTRFHWKDKFDFKVIRNPKNG
jgi:glycosyltransferase involved in cell wall biosynthesis